MKLNLSLHLLNFPNFVKCSPSPCYLYIWEGNIRGVKVKESSKTEIGNPETAAKLLKVHPSEAVLQPQRKLRAPTGRSPQEMGPK